MNAKRSTPQARHLTGLFPALLGVGGVQEAGRLTAAALNEIVSRHQWSSEFLALNDPPGAHEFAQAARTINFTGFGRAKIKFALAAIAAARTASSSNPAAPPIVLATHPNLALPAAWMQRMSWRLKIIVMAHGVEVWEPLSSSRRRALRRADLVLAPSTYTAQKLSEVQAIAPEKIRVLPWPLNPDFIRLAENPAALPPPPQSFPQGRIIMTAGRWSAAERYKGADELIHAIAQLRAAHPNVRLVAVGSGDDLPRLRQLSRDVGAAENIHFLENLTREQIAACYARAEIFALPSSGEGFGFVFLEAMVFAKPVVAAAIGGPTDLIDHGSNGFLVPPRDAASLAQSLDRLLRDDSLRAEMGRRGLARVRAKYRFEVFEAALEHLLEGESMDSRTSSSSESDASS
jgi:phosphatidylinositol alpha-1,6-mannosyltransferase